MDALFDPSAATEKAVNAASPLDLATGCRVQTARSTACEEVSGWCRPASGPTIGYGRWVARRLRAARERTSEEREFALRMCRRLALGRPVRDEEAAAIARGAGIDPEHLERLLLRGAEVGPDGAIVGFSGLSLTRHPHRIVAPERVLYAWCALDPFFLVPALGIRAEVETADPRTGTRVRFRLSPLRVESVEPPAAVLSIPHTQCAPGDLDSRAEVQSSFCTHANLFEDVSSAAAPR
jgi:hypothetical protein